MCVGICGHLFRERIEWCPFEGDQSYSKNLVRLGITDVSTTPDFVAFELHPLDELTSTDPKDWKFNVGDVYPAPQWFVDGLATHEEYVIAAHCARWANIPKDYPGSLDLFSCKMLKSLGALRSVAGYFNLAGTGVESLGALESVGRHLDLTFCKMLKSLGALMWVGGDLDLFSCKRLKSLGALMWVGGYLDLRDSGVKSIPPFICSPERVVNAK